MTIEEKRAMAIERLDATIEKIKTLQPNQFNYNSFVSGGKNGCGTTCCVAGWYPIWFPESELNWINSNNNYEGKEIILLNTPKCTIITPTIIRNTFIMNTLSKYHYLSIFTIKALFFGSCLLTKSLNDNALNSVPFGHDPEISEILARFETVRALLRIGTNDHLLSE